MSAFFKITLVSQSLHSLVSALKVGGQLIIQFKDYSYFSLDNFAQTKYNYNMYNVELYKNQGAIMNFNYISTKEAAQILGVTERYVQMLCKEGNFE